MKLKLKTVNQMISALGGMSGRNRIIEADGKVTGQAFEPYAFPAQTRVNIVRNLNVLRPLAEVYTDARKELIKTLSPDGTPKAVDDNPVLAAKFTKENDDLLNSKVDAKGLAAISYADLETAKVDPQTITLLGVLVRGTPEVKAEDLLPDSLGESEEQKASS